ncbi:MAG: hypothetical protein K0R57_900 [Paenibacillaceae bacterium]|jgi:hypothetical protein|nr:hypothetical protein [Paenibacillaceae bacterium]
MKLHAKYRNKKQGHKTTNPIIFSVYIGYFAGILWGGVKLLEFAMKFTEVVPGFLLEPFFRHSFLIAWQGLALGYASFVGLSVLAAAIYGMFLRKLKGPWPGIGYGLAWWCVLYLLVGPLTEMVPAITQLDLNSFVTDLCLFMVWGLFIGFSIAMEFTEERIREPGGRAKTPALK